MIEYGNVAFEQADIFSELYPKFKITKPVRLIELFAGIGSQAKALKNLGIPMEHWKAVEIDKYAMASYNAVHGTSFSVTDVKDIHAEDLDMRERERYCYILTYSFPCTDLSLAGQMMGMDKGSGTRSSLLWEVERLLEECGKDLPHVLLMENVPQVIGKKNIENFQLWRKKLEDLGYQNYVELLNAKDYGIPQNRERCFMVSILGEYSYTFPQKKELTLRLKDMLEDDVDEKFYLTEEQLKYFIANDKAMRESGHGFKFEPHERERESSEDDSDENGSHGRCVDSRIIQIGNLKDDTGRKFTNPNSGRVYGIAGISPTITTMQGGNLEPKIIV